MIKWVWVLFWIVVLGIPIAIANALIFAIATGIYIMTRVNILDIVWEYEDCKTWRDCWDFAVRGFEQ